MKKTLYPSLLALFLAGCGPAAVPAPAPDTNPEVVQPNQDPGVQKKDPSTVTYPPAPYGVNAGDVLKNISLYGYRDPSSTASKYEIISLSDFYDPDGSAGRKVLFVNVAAGWCPPCRGEAPDLLKMCNALKSQGLSCYTAIVEDVAHNAAQRDAINEWSTAFSLNYSIVHDPAPKWGPYFNISAFPMNMFIDLKSMKILEQINGADPAGIEAAAKKHLAAYK